MEAASCRAVRTTFVGSMMPALTRSSSGETSCFDLLVIVKLIAVHKTGVHLKLPLSAGDLGRLLALSRHECEKFFGAH
jgi:hypothetical protein